MFLAFFISFLAGISTLLGCIIIFLDKDKDKIVYRSLSFSSGVMISICIFDLIPSSIKGLNEIYYIFFAFIISLVFINVGIIFSLFINKNISNKMSENNSLYKLGIFSVLAIVMHNIPEGIATFLTSSNDIKLGVMFAISIALHNIPEGICISIPIYYSTGSKLKSITYTFISGISEFFGAIIAFLFLRNIATTSFIYYVYSFVSGIMLYLSLFEMLPQCFCKSRVNLNIIVYFVSGFSLMILLHLI